MLNKLRPYQQAAHDAAWQWIRSNLEPCVIDAATGSGKSHMLAALAKTFYDSTGKHVLCTAPSAELVQQNSEKYTATGEPASIYSATAGSKCIKHPVIFGTPLTIKGGIEKLKGRIGLVVIDECHSLTPTIKSIIKELRSQNDRLRVVGLSATPYRMNTGYIYQVDENGVALGENKAKDPYFAKLVYKITAHELIKLGYVTPPVIGEINSDHYQTKHMQLNAMGNFRQADIDKAYHGQGRKTSRIIADIIAQSKDRRGVIIFAATVDHAKECMQSLPPELSVIVTSETKRKERKQIVADIKAMKYKYVVNVGVFTTGFDAEHIDVVALLRLMESVGLMQQMAGRGSRLYPGKDNFLVLDYAQNIDRHCPDGDLYNPDIKVKFTSSSEESIIVECPKCGGQNEVIPRDNDEGFGLSDDGYFTDLDGNILRSEFGPIPSHYGRRCQSLVKDSQKNLVQCTYRWTYKKCPKCRNENDISARKCESCRAEIVNPNEKLIATFKKKKRDPYQRQCDVVNDWVISTRRSKNGNRCLVVDFYTDYRKVTAWYVTDSPKPFLMKKYNEFLESTSGGRTKPETITYKKNINTGYFEIIGYNQPHDQEPTPANKNIRKPELSQQAMSQGIG